MGRSENSRNRIFERFDGGMRTKAFDESKLSDPHLIIYNPYLSAKGGNIDIITNGDQTNTIFDHINEVDHAFGFESACDVREFEDDAPNDKIYTKPQILPVDINNHNVGAEIDMFVEAILAGAPMPVSSMEGASTVAVCSATVESAREGKPIQITYPKA
jgi:predicted dehydrogenase